MTANGNQPGRSKTRSYVIMFLVCLLVMIIGVLLYNGMHSGKMIKGQDQKEVLKHNIQQEGKH